MKDYESSKCFDCDNSMGFDEEIGRVRCIFSSTGYILPKYIHCNKYVPKQRKPEVKMYVIFFNTTYEQNLYKKVYISARNPEEAFERFKREYPGFYNKMIFAYIVEREEGYSTDGTGKMERGI
jgi:hypothetical protein